jgi:hypothetical protein
MAKPLTNALGQDENALKLRLQQYDLILADRHESVARGRSALVEPAAPKKSRTALAGRRRRGKKSGG